MDHGQCRYRDNNYQMGLLSEKKEDLGFGRYKCAKTCFSSLIIMLLCYVFSLRPQLCTYVVWINHGGVGALSISL